MTVTFQSTYDLLDDGQYESLLLVLPAFDLIWTDPPWGNGTLKMFRSTVNRMGAEGTWETLMSRLAHLCTKALLGAFVMMGTRFTPSLKDIFASEGLYVRKSWVGVYSAKKLPVDYLYFSPDLSEMEIDLNGVNANKQAGLQFLRTFPTSTRVFDPFTGLGDIVATTNALKMRCLCNEINPDRLAKAARRR